MKKNQFFSLLREMKAEATEFKGKAFIFLIFLSFSVIKGTYRSTTKHSKHE